MKKFFLFLLLSCSILSYVSADDDNTRGILRLDIPVQLSSGTQAANLLIEGGNRYWRLNGTYGFIPCAGERAKFTAEFLSSKDRYRIGKDTSSHWIGQIAFGYGYQKMLSHPLFLALNFESSYSHAFGKKFCNTQLFEKRRVTSSNMYDFAYGATVRSFCRGFINLYGTWDYLKFDRESRKDKEIMGSGFKFELFQPLFSPFELYFKGEFKRPYNYCEAKITYPAVTRWGICNAALFGSRINGKSGLRNETRIGVEVGIQFCRKINAECVNSSPCQTECNRSLCSISEWVSRPAVYRARILAIGDATKVVPPPICPPCPECPVCPICPDYCAFPGNQISAKSGTIELSPGFDIHFAADDFSGGLYPILYTSSDPDNFPVDPGTGEVRNPGNLSFFAFTITAENDCGSASIYYTVPLPP